MVTILQESTKSATSRPSRPGDRPKVARAGKSGGAGRSPLDTSQINTPPPIELRKQRKYRYARRTRSAKFLKPLAVESLDGYKKPVRVASCGTPIGDVVSIHDCKDSTVPAGFGNVEHCNSIWACPCCGAVIRSERAKEIQQAVAAHQKTGGQLLFFTGTLRHHAGDSLNETLDAILKAWSKLIQNTPWKKKKERFGINGYIRSVEITYSEKNGWHPHVHVLLFLDEEMTDLDFEFFKGWLFDRWAMMIERHGCGVPTKQGLNLQKVDKKGEVLGKYLAKFQEEKSWRVGSEMARSDVKHGRSTGSINPFELLSEDCGLTEKKRQGLWIEYYKATKGRRALTWSRGLKKRFDIGELNDEEIIDELEKCIPVWHTSAKYYRRLLQHSPEELAQALDYAETENWEALEQILPRFHGFYGAKSDNDGSS